MAVRKSVVCLLAVLILAAVACNRTVPEIAYGFIELVYYEDKPKPLEHFSFFIIPEDDDGIENLADLYLYHDREQLRWHISGDDWITYTDNGKTWVGTRGIAVGEDESLPRGQFRAVLINKGGERSERNFSFDAPEEPVYPFPSITIQNRQYTVVSSYPLNQLVYYDGQGNYLHTTTLTGLSGSLDDAEIPSEAQSAALWAQDTARYTSAFTNVAAIH